MKKVMGFREMLDRSFTFWGYWIALFLSGGVLIAIGGGVLFPIDWRTIGIITVILGGICLVLSFACYIISLRWDRRAR